MPSASEPPKLKAIVERQSGEIRGLAREVRRWAEEHDNLSAGKLGTIHGWADTLDGIADELVEAMATPSPDRGRLKLLGVATVGILQLSASVFGIAADGTEVIDRWAIPERVRERVAAVEQGVGEIDDGLDLDVETIRYSRSMGRRIADLVKERLTAEEAAGYHNKRQFRLSSADDGARIVLSIHAGGGKTFRVGEDFPIAPSEQDLIDLTWVVTSFNSELDQWIAHDAADDTSTTIDGG